MSLNGAFSEMFGGQQRAAATDKSYLSGWGGFLSFGTGGNGSFIKPATALKLSAFYNGVDQISNDIAKIPFAVYKKEGENRILQGNHPGHILISQAPNPLMTSFVFRKTMGVSLLIKGNALAYIEENAAGIAVATHFINWEKVQDVRLKDNQLVYDVQGYNRPLLASEVLHLKNFSHDGVVGVGCITYAAQQLNLAIEVQTYSATSFENKGIRNGVVEYEKPANPEAKAKIIAGWRATMGEKSPDRIAVLDDGMKFKAINITPQEAQIIEQARFSIEDIARWLNIAPHKIKSLQQSTNNNIEQQSLDHVSDTIQPHITNIEQEYAKKLLSDREKQSGFFVKGNMNVLLRADSAARGEYYSKMVTAGVYSRQEIRRLEDQNDGPEFLSQHLTPVNTFTESQINQNLKANGNQSK